MKCSAINWFWLCVLVMTTNCPSLFFVLYTHQYVEINTINFMYLVKMYNIISATHKYIQTAYTTANAFTSTPCTMVVLFLRFFYTILLSILVFVFFRQSTCDLSHRVVSRYMKMRPFKSIFVVCVSRWRHETLS